MSANSGVIDKAVSLIEQVKPYTGNQKKLINIIRDEKTELIGVFGPSGTGKSYIVLSQAILLLLKNKYNKIVIGRPIVGVNFEDIIASNNSFEVYKEHMLGYIMDLVGSINNELVGIVNDLINKNKIEIIDPLFLRGRTFDKSFIFIDDIQNTTIEIIIESITRIGMNSKLVLAGDPVFQHLYPGSSHTAALTWEILQNEPNSAVIDLGIKDVVRPGARRGLRLLLESVLRRRMMSDVEQKVYDSFKLYAPDSDIITVINLIDIKKDLEITSEHVPDVIAIVKPNHVPRAIGVGGERIQKVQEDTGLKIRVTELTLNLKTYFRAIHPVSWIHKHIRDADLEGPYVVAYVSPRYIGPLVGQKGVYARFMDAFFRRLLGIGFKAKEYKK